MKKDEIMDTIAVISEAMKDLTTSTCVTAKQFGRNGVPGEGTSYEFVIQHVDGDNIRQVTTIVPALSSPNDLIKVFQSIIKKMRKEGMTGDSRSLHEGTISLHVTAKNK